MAVLKVSSSLRKYIFSSGENRFKSKVKEDRGKMMIFQYLINLRKFKRQFGFITTIVYYCLWEFKLKFFSLVLFKFFELFFAIYTSLESI